MVKAHMQKMVVKDGKIQIHLEVEIALQNEL
jgi:hypothetical protein